MKTIYKYPLSVGLNNITLPEGYQIRKFGIQDDQLYLWVEIKKDTIEKNEDVIIEVFGTGWMMPNEPGSYIDSVITRDSFVWHAYKKD